MPDIMKFYKGLFYRYFGFEPVINYGRDGAVIKRLLDVLTPQQLRLFIVIHFNWRGMDGTDEFNYKRLKNNSFPIGWISTNINSYMAYAKNVLELDMSDEKVLEEYINDFLK